MLAKKKDNSQKKLSNYLTKIEGAERHRDSAYKELWIRAYQRWRNYVQELKDKDRSNISIPYVFTQVETILPRLVETLFASRPYVSIKGREQFDIPNARKMEVLLDWQMNERVDFQDLFNTGLKELCIYGTAIGYVGWRYETKKTVKKQPLPVTDIDPTSGQEVPLLDEMNQPIMDYQPIEQTEVSYDDPDPKFVDLGLFYVDPSATEISDARFCGHIEFKTREELQELVDEGIYDIDFKKVEKQSHKNQARDYRQSSVGIPSNDDSNIDSVDNSELYEVLHYWEEDKHVVIINRSWLAMDGENPFWHKKKPYVKEVYTVVPHEFYGMGICEILTDLHDELNTERNMRIDYRAFLLRRMFKVRRGARVDKKQLKWRQGGIIECDDPDDVTPLEITDTSGSSFNQESVIKTDIQDTTGGHAVIMGTSNDETATGTMAKDNNASLRFKLVISRIEKKLLVGMAKLMIQLNQQFIDTERVLRIAGVDGNNDQYQMLSPEEIQGEFDLIAMGSSVEPLANREAYKQRMVELYNIIGKDPIYQQYPDKRRNLIQKVLESFDIKDISNLLPSPEELAYQQMLQQQMQMAQMQMQSQQQQFDQDHRQQEMAMRGREMELKHGFNNSGKANSPAMQEQGQQMNRGRV